VSHQLVIPSAPRSTLRDSAFEALEEVELGGRTVAEAVAIARQLGAGAAAAVAIANVIGADGALLEATVTGHADPAHPADDYLLVIVRVAAA
jgi:hypothetical protein